MGGCLGRVRSRDVARAHAWPLGSAPACLPVQCYPYCQASLDWVAVTLLSDEPRADKDRHRCNQPCCQTAKDGEPVVHSVDQKVRRCQENEIRWDGLYP